jgi:LacI family transcriptional regulator
MAPPKRVAARLSSDVVAIDDAAIAQAMRIIRDRACDGMKVEQLLGELSVSRATLERRFRQLLGRSPKAEIDRVRCARAQRLLAETTYPLARIAEMAGYRTAAHFVTAFKRMTGGTPGHFRTARA